MGQGKDCLVKLLTLCELYFRFKCCFALSLLFSFSLSPSLPHSFNARPRLQTKVPRRGERERTRERRGPPPPNLLCKGHSSAREEAPVVGPSPPPPPPTVAQQFLRRKLAQKRRLPLRFPRHKNRLLRVLVRESMGGT